MASDDMQDEFKKFRDFAKTPYGRVEMNRHENIVRRAAAKAQSSDDGVDASNIGKPKNQK